MAYDNAVSALGKICQFHRDSINAAQVHHTCASYLNLACDHSIILTKYKLIIILLEFAVMLDQPSCNDSLIITVRILTCLYSKLVLLIWWAVIFQLLPILHHGFLECYIGSENYCKIFMDSGSHFYTQANIMILSTILYFRNTVWRRRFSTILYASGYPCKYLIQCENRIEDYMCSLLEV